MAQAHPVQDRLRELLQVSLANARRDALALTVATFALLPALCGAAALLLVIAMSLSFDVADAALSLLGYGGTFFMGVNLFLAGTWLTLLLRRGREPAARRRIARAAGALVLLVLSALGAAHGHAAFAVPYLALTILFLGTLGELYHPADDDDAALLESGGSPARLLSRLDRGRVALGLATIVPELIVGALLEVGRGAWLLRRYDAEALRLAAAIVHGLAGEEEAEAARLLSRPGGQAASARRLVSRLGLVTIGGPAPRLTAEGHHLLGAARISGRVVEATR